MNEPWLRGNKIVPYSSSPSFSDDATYSPTNSQAQFRRKGTPRIVTFTAGSGMKKSKKRRMR